MEATNWFLDSSQVGVIWHVRPKCCVSAVINVACYSNWWLNYLVCYYCDLLCCRTCKFTGETPVMSVVTGFVACSQGSKERRNFLWYYYDLNYLQVFLDLFKQERCVKSFVFDRVSFHNFSQNWLLSFFLFFRRYQRAIDVEKWWTKIF